MTRNKRLWTWVPEDVWRVLRTLRVGTRSRILALLLEDAARRVLQDRTAFQKAVDDGRLGIEVFPISSPDELEAAIELVMDTVRREGAVDRERLKKLDVPQLDGILKGLMEHGWLEALGNQDDGFIYFHSGFHSELAGESESQDPGNG